MKPIGCGLLAACLLALPSRAAEVDQLLPEDAGAVVFVNVRQALDSALMKKYGQGRAQAALQSSEYTQLLRSAGVDPLRDLSSVTVAVAATDSTKGLMILHGKFDSGRILAKATELAKEKGSRVKIISTENPSVYEIASANATVGKAYVAVLDGQTMVAAPERAWVDDAIAKHAGKRAGKVKPLLRKTIQDEDAKQSFWMVIPEGKFLASARFAADDKVREVLGRTESVRLGITVSDGVKLKLTVAATSTADAKAIKKDLDGALESAKAVIALVGENRPELAPLGDILDTITLKEAGKVLLLEVHASAAVIDKALEKARRPASRP